MQSERICRECRFWVSPDTMRGHCYLNPPVVVVMPVMVDTAGGGLKKADSKLATPTVQEMILPTAQRPLTLASDFCREWTVRT